MHPPNAYSLLFNPCESLCPSVCPFVTKIDVAFLSLRHNSLQVFVIFTHSLFRHTFCWDLLLYQSDVNLILNDDFAHCSQHFQTKFCQRFRSSFMWDLCTRWTLTSCQITTLFIFSLKQATLWYRFLLSIKCQLSFKRLSNAWHLNKLLDLASHTLKSIFKAVGHQLCVEWRLRSL